MICGCRHRRHRCSRMFLLPVVIQVMLWLLLVPSTTMVSSLGITTLLVKSKSFVHQIRRKTFPHIIVKFEDDPPTHTNETIDNYFMDIALQQAQKAGRKGEVPIGAIVVESTTSIPPKLTTTSSSSDTSSPSTSTTTTTPTTFYEVLSKGYNRVEQYHDASAHAEMMALKQAGSTLGNWRLGSSHSHSHSHSGTTNTDNTTTTTTNTKETILYSTLEPCPMCLAACQAFRINKVVYGAPDLRLGAHQTHMNLLEVADHPFHNISSVKSGIRQDESAALLRTFFRQRRQQSKLANQKEKAQKQQRIAENKRKKNQTKKDNAQRTTTKKKKNKNKHHPASSTKKDTPTPPMTTKRRIQRILCFWRRNNDK